MLFPGWVSAQAVRQSERREIIVQPNQAFTVNYDQPYTSALRYINAG